MSFTRQAISAGVVMLSSATTTKRPSAPMPPSAEAAGATNVSIATGLPSSVSVKSSCRRVRTEAPLRSSTTTGTTTRSVEA